MQIELDRLRLSRSGRSILREVSWSIGPGQRWLVVGASGAGKTQLLKIVSGDVWPDESPSPARRYRIGRQWHVQPVEARDEIAWLGPERQDRYERYGWNHSAIEVVGTGLHRTDIPLQPLTKAQRRTCLTLLRRAGIARLAERGFLTLSYGERRLVLLARALAWRAAVLLLDEVATGLDTSNRARLYRLLASRTLRHSTWICSAHREEDIPPGATHLLWLEAGRVRYAGPVTQRQLGAALKASQARPRRPVLLNAAPRKAASRKARPRSARPLLSLSRANVWVDAKRVLKEVDLSISRGECWMLHGANGSGKTTLLRTLYGDHGVATGGRITRLGVARGVPLDDFRARTGLIAPHLQTDYPRHHSVLDTVVSGLHSSIGLNWRATPAEQRRARSALRSIDMEEFADRALGEMSYGQVRRILFARALVVRPRLLLLDEPFTGLSAALRAMLMEWLEARVQAGVTVVMATHYRSEWPRGATHELQLRQGRVVYAGTIRR